MKKSISVVIPNYNGKKLLEQNLPFVYNALKTSGVINYEVIISDDCSRDDSVRFINENYPSIVLIENKINLGFAGNTNKGIKVATKELVLILNSDVQLTNNYFDTLFKYFEKEDTFGVFSKIIGLDSVQIQDGAKYPSYSFANIKGSLNYLNQEEKNMYTFFLSGANALISRDKLIELGGFCELFNPYYWEDVDLGLRAWKLGYKLYFDSNAVCKHPLSSTIKKESSKKVKIITKRNKMFLHYLHLEGLELFFYIFIIFLKSSIRILIGDMNYFKAFIMFVSFIPKLKQYKNQFFELQKSKNIKLNTRDIVKIIKDDINYDKIHKF